MTHNPMTQATLPIVDEVADTRAMLMSIGHAVLDLVLPSSMGESSEQRLQFNSGICAAAKLIKERAAALVSPPTQAGGDPVPVAYADSRVLKRLVPGEENGTMHGRPRDEFSVPLYAAPIASKEACGDVIGVTSDGVEVLAPATTSDAFTRAELRAAVLAAIRALTPNPGAAE